MGLAANDAVVRNQGAAESMNGTPTVSFIVLCYKLAHLLSECVNSILSQSYGDFEVLIMDDCSPDNTEEVAKSFRDSRVKYVRNPQNLGFLRNENEGVRLSRGKYVWIISADDYLRKPFVLQHYVELMDANPSVGISISSGMGVRDGRETQVVPSSKHRQQNEIIRGHEFLRTLIYGNIVLAPSVLVRRECYEKISVYPLSVPFADIQIDMVWAADWYLWCVFALSYDVAYFAEPMVCYREHDLSMTSVITKKENVEICVAADIAVPWLVRQKAEEAGLKNLSRDCLRAVAHEYALHGNGKWYRGGKSSMSLEDFELSLSRGTQIESERDWIRSRFYAAKGDACFASGDLAGARGFYVASLRKDPLLLSVYPKLLFSLGKPGLYLRRLLRSLRELPG